VSLRGSTAAIQDIAAAIDRSVDGKAATLIFPSITVDYSYYAQQFLTTCFKVFSDFALQCVSKKFTRAASYNFELILIIFGRLVTEKVSDETMLYFPPHLTSASVLPGETTKPGNYIYSLKCCVFILVNKHTKHIKYQKVAAELTFTVK